jgi:hypothetical protein
VPCSLSAAAPTVLRIWRPSWTHVAAGEVTALEHELGNDTVELGARVAKALLARAESAEVLGGARHDVVVELKVDAAGLVCGRRRQQLIPACGDDDGGDGIALSRRYTESMEGATAYPLRRLWR